MFSEMITGVKMRVLEVFLLAVLGCSLAEGRLVSKCELKDQLMTAFGKLMVKAEKGQRVENLVAKIVCHVELTSDFNTSAVNQLTLGMDDHHSREKREAVYMGLFGQAERQDHSGEQDREDMGRPSKTRPTPTNPTPSITNTNSTLPTTPILPTLSPNLPTNLNQSTTILPRKRRYARHPPFNHPQQLDKEVWTLYGLFQLSSHLVCNDTTLTPNICGMDCNNLLDDAISDDISCLMTILNQQIAKGFGAPHWKELSKMIRLIFQQECSDQDASEYFAECP